MRISTDDAGKEPWYVVWLDGTLVPWAKAADDEEGWVEFYRIDRIEDRVFMRIIRKRGEVKLEKVYGG